MKSPCILVCRVEGNLCAGCSRTLDEIARWSKMSEEERARVVAAAEARKAAEA